MLLGTSVESVRRRIKAGRIDAFHDARGRIRIRASLPPATDVQVPAASATELWNQLKAARLELTGALEAAEELRRELGLAHYHRREAQQEVERLGSQALSLQGEIEASHHQLDHTRQDLAALWRVMSSRNQQAGAQLAEMADGNEAFDLIPAQPVAGAERSRIRDQIDRVRDLSKRRRRWPWPQAS